MKITRRDFLKSASVYTLGLLGAFAQPTFKHLRRSQTDAPNIIILLFDALAARNMSLYGYPRQTTPEMARFAERATVFHRHYAAGNFTSPGTASLLTGTYPWTHRALQQAGPILKKLADRNLFRSFDGIYQKAAFAQNLWVDLFLYQFENSIDVHLKSTAYSHADYIHYNDGLWKNDPLISFRAYDDFLEQDYGIPGSLYFSLADKLRGYLANELAPQPIKEGYARGIPNFSKYKVYFTLEEVFDGVAEELTRLEEPFLSYFHLWPPHDPYFPNRRFIGMFDDNWSPVSKPRHPLATGPSDEALDGARRQYDEYVANVDAEFGRLYDRLLAERLLENSYLIVTSDHGEMFERGVSGHVTPLLYDPVIHVPLLISAPGQRTRQDVYALTSCVDLLPTLLRLTGGSTPDWLEGTLLPSFGRDEASHLPVFAVEAKKNPAHSPITHGTFAMMEGDHKLIWYTGYPGYEDAYELYNMKDDPEELRDLSTSQTEALKRMKNILHTRLMNADEPFRIER